MARGTDAAPPFWACSLGGHCEHHETQLALDGAQGWETELALGRL